MLPSQYIGRVYIEEKNSNAAILKDLDEIQHLLPIVVPDGDSRANMVYDRAGSPMGVIGDFENV